MAKPGTLVLTGYGINCEEETAFAFNTAGSSVRIIHINDLIDNNKILDQYQVLVFPGGFSYGDDTGSGKALANRMKNNLFEDIRKFIDRDTLTLGICNGFQVLVNLGLLPLINRFDGTAQTALEYNESFRYQCRWVDVMVEKDSPSVFTRNIDRMHIPVAHGEGNFYAPENIITKIESMNLVSMRYIKSDGTRAKSEFPYNPNGAMNDIASICSPDGRIMGMMPHPERGIFFTQRDDWTLLKEKYIREGKDIPVYSDGLTLFKNAVDYFQ